MNPRGIHHPSMRVPLSTDAFKLGRRAPPRRLDSPSEDVTGRRAHRRSVGVIEIPFAVSDLVENKIEGSYKFLNIWL